MINTQVAQNIQTKMILEGANGPTLTESDEILSERHITVVPDVICNAGGVTVSYFEWVQDLASYFWTEEEINQRMDASMKMRYRMYGKNQSRPDVLCVQPLIFWPVSGF